MVQLPIKRYFLGALLGVNLAVGVGAVCGTHRAGAFTQQTLVYGSQGYDVDELQSRMKLLGYYWRRVNGTFDWDTYWALRTFQYNFGMRVTGTADEETKIKLVQATPSWQYHSAAAQTTTSASAPTSPWMNRWRHPASSQSGGTSTGTVDTSHSSNASSAAQAASAASLSPSDLALMQHVVYGEARGEPFTGEIAIAAVILNRLKDPKFPRTVPGIIYQPGAFTSVGNGQVNLQPDPKSMQAVFDAIHGMDPSMGATYYFNPATASSQWIWSRPEITKIGKHIFCR